MPVLPDDMYCSEQICIPPSFPYLLRQYAKAAIRTQPTDLLKWSTAYFRCLALNIHPPVKPRLEYPIPRDYKGITPGWLKALLYQLQNNLTIPFKILWDRWIGACLQHHTLIQILCLGGFDDAQTIPWLRFIAICAGTLSDDLTHTMILICEILSEEPEGGSAMITLETFVDLYTFLAKIDASKDQTLRNYFFRDSLLSLWREKVEKEEEKEVEQEVIIPESEESIASKASSESIERVKSDDLDKVVSCPSLPEDDHYSIDYLLKEADEGAEEFEQEMPIEIPGEEEEGRSATEPKEDLDEEGRPADEHEEKDEGDQKSDEHKKDEEKSEEGEEKEEHKEEAEETDIQDEQEEKEDVELKEEVPTVEENKEEEQAKEGEEDGLKEYESVETITDQPVRDLQNVFEDDATLKEDLERLRALQQELAGETDEELEKFKCRLIEEMPLTESQGEGIKHFKIDKLEHVSSEEKLKVISGENLKSGDISSDSQEPEEDKRQFDNVFFEAIPGIGETVSDELIKAVVEYMKNCAKIQHGMVMPRNIRHYSCPPLEVMNY